MDKLLDFFGILSDETRLRIIVLLNYKELCVCEICEILGLSQPKVSRHLSKLRDAGVVTDSRQGQWVFYYLDMKDNVMKNLISIIADNKEQYPVLKRDIQKLRKKLEEHRMCSREHRKEKGKGVPYLMETIKG